MWTNVFGLVFLLALAQAVPLHQDHHQAISFSSFNQNLGLGHQSQAGPALFNVGVAAPVHAAPLLAASHAPAQSYSSLSLLQNSAPFGHFAAPSISGHVAPVAVAHSAPVLVKTAHHEEDYYAHPKYEFAYGVEDHHTGDIHSQKESRDGDVVHGEYSLHEADGTVRVVKYAADKHNGFNAIVERTGHAVHAQPAPVHKAIVAAPIVKTIVAAPGHHHY